MNVGKLVCRQGFCFGWAGGADGLPHVRCLRLSHLCLESWCALSLASCMDGLQGWRKSSFWDCILCTPGFTAAQPWEEEWHCPSHALVNVTRTCLQTEAEGWDGQAGAGRALLFLVFPSIAQNRERAAPLCCLTVRRNKLDSKTQHSFLGTRSGGHRTPQFPFLISLLFGFSKLLCKRGWMGGRGSAFLGSPRLNVYDL